MSDLNLSGNRRKSKETGGKKRKKQEKRSEFRKEAEKAAKSLVRDQKAAGERADRRPSRASPQAKEGERINRNEWSACSKGDLRRLRLRFESRHFD